MDLFKNASAKELWYTIQQALEVFANNRKFTRMRKNALSRNCGMGMCRRTIYSNLQVGTGYALIFLFQSTTKRTNPQYCYRCG